MPLWYHIKHTRLWIGWFHVISLIMGMLVLSPLILLALMLALFRLTKK